MDHPKPLIVEKVSEAEQSSGRPHDLISVAKKLAQGALKDALAPWSSLVQRIGPCNRRANIPDAEVL
jgi:hypothetical protein